MQQKYPRTLVWCIEIHLKQTTIQVFVYIQNAEYQIELCQFKILNVTNIIPCNTEISDNFRDDLIFALFSRSLLNRK